MIQKAVKERRLLAGHDVSDGGVLVALAEMAFAGNVHVEANFTAKTGKLARKNAKTGDKQTG